MRFTQREQGTGLPLQHFLLQFLLFHGTAPPPPPQWARTSSLSGFMIALRHTTVGSTPLEQWSARHRDLYLTTHNTHNRQTPNATGGIRTHNPNKRAAADPRLGPVHLVLRWYLLCSRLCSCSCVHSKCLLEDWMQATNGILWFFSPCIIIGAFIDSNERERVPIGEN